MDGFDLLELCVRASRTANVPGDLHVPKVFSLGDIEQLWRRDPSRVRKAIDDVLTSDSPGTGLDLLLRAGAFGALIPEVEAMHRLGDDPEAALHKDVWDHTKQVVAGTPALLELRWAALMHDVGKSQTRRVVRGKVTFHNHDVVGAFMVDRIQKRLDLFRDDRHLLDTVRSLVLNHLRPAAYKASWTDSGVRRLLSDVGGMAGFERLMLLSRADLTTKNPGRRDRCLRRGDELVARVKQVFAHDNAPKLPKGTMGEVLARSGRRPGPWLNAIRQALEDSLAAGVLEAGRDVEFYVAEGLRSLSKEDDR